SRVWSPAVRSSDLTFRRTFTTASRSTPPLSRRSSSTKRTFGRLKSTSGWPHEDRRIRSHDQLLVGQRPRNALAGAHQGARAPRPRRRVLRTGRAVLRVSPRLAYVPACGARAAPAFARCEGAGTPRAPARG